MITRKFWNCSSSRFHQGVSGALLSWFGPYCSRRRCASAPAQAARGVGAERRNHRCGRLAMGRGRKAFGSAALSRGRDARRAASQVTSVTAFDAGSRCNPHALVGFRKTTASVGIRTGVAGRMGGGSVLAVRAFDQPHHLIGIDQRGGANPDEGERAGDIPIGHLVSAGIRLGLLGWASPAPGNERDQACQNEEQRAGQREYEVSRQRSGGYRQDSESDQESDGESDLRAERPRVAADARNFWPGG